MIHPSFIPQHSAAMNAKNFAKRLFAAAARKWFTIFYLVRVENVLFETMETIKNRKLGGA
jgi:hypothetical protein